MKQNEGKKKQIARSPVDRRQIKDRRSCLELEEYFSQNTERRKNEADRRQVGERRKLD